ncbi:MAG: sigma-54-dependent Fis family transcriptional regulator [Deltaproteobacteria bacterium]|nr:sigma-54-dependent Fis family transcriptional regulator [Deltaproteobacteria bacterium]
MDTDHSEAVETDSETKSLLVVDDETNMRHMLESLLKNHGYRIESAEDGEKALGLVRSRTYDFILCDLKMPHMDGLAFLSAAREYLQNTTVIMMSAFGTLDTALSAIQQGAYDFITKPFKPDEVLLTLKKAQERENLKKENIRLKERIRTITTSYHFGKMMAKSKPMQQVFKTAAKASQYDTTVLITGESGTGKELVTKGIHFSGPRSKKPFIAVNCAGIPENLLESELFGYKKGAFTGADKDKSGLFEVADTGTLFLDEIGEMPMSLQVKLLRVLQEREITPIGASIGKKVDVRIIAATSKDLAVEAAQGKFREDLFYRLNVLAITLPTLRERPEDIPLLSQNFIRKFNRKLKTQIQGITPAAMSLLLAHDWPGNVRQLENIIERAMVLTEEVMLHPEVFSPEFGENVASDKFDLFDTLSLKAAKRIVEKMLISKALETTGGNRTRAAQLLEISHPSLLSKMKSYEVDG